MTGRTPHGLLYSISSFGISLSSFVVSTYISYFYIALMGLPPRWVGWGLFAFSWWNAFNDAVVGWLSDRTRTRWGRRIPYIFTLTLPLALSFVGLWTPPFSRTQPVWLFAYMMAVVTIHDLLYTLVGVNVAALFPEMFPSLAERARVNGWRQIMSLLGMLVGVVAAPLIASRMGWRGMGLLFGLAIVLTLSLSLRGSREHLAYSRGGGQASPWGAWRRALEQRAFVVFLGITFLIRLALTTLNSTMPFYASYVLGLGPDGAAWLLGSALLVALLAMQPWACLLARWGARGTALAAQLAVGMAVLPLLAAQNLATAVAAAGLAGVSLAGLLITPEVLLAEVIDADHASTGQRHEGVYFGLGNVVNRLPNVLQAAGIGELLAWSGFDPSLATQPAGVVTGLRLLIGGVPAAALAVAALLTLAYPLHGEQLTRIKAQVTILRAAAERGCEA